MTRSELYSIAMILSSLRAFVVSLIWPQLVLKG